MTKIYDTIIIGAGISGLIAATHLQNSGKDVVVVDKSRGVGGRMATRRIGEATFDHGAQFFTVRSEAFANFISQNEDCVHHWCDGFLFGDDNSELRKDGHPRYCGAKGMTTLAKKLATNLNVQLKEKIQSAVYKENWCVSGVEDYHAKSLILTAPIPQSLAILEGVEFDGRGELAKIEYTPCFAVMVKTSAASNIPQPGGIKNASTDIEWLGDNMQKGISAKPGITIHSTPEFTEKNWDRDFDEVAKILLQQADKWLGGEVEDYQVHRWRYCAPKQVYPQRCFVAKEIAMGMCGDAFAGPKVEGAFLSGVAMAQEMLA
ncbi:NAD(P)/FAD-dependent oxidoreductase [Candidatus Uabimicrobium amorphum]|uniref:Deoxyribodipyrimidine photo-lyase n=1 Tax=Uabimicrobium amorphum TaxID=2596890 RepID=A0A5S9F5N2_UABAM|nr:FAD-dependent oxidoreductase [Candidatus Uabimicrobium amorphum]BBM85744.1 deoxyribodipyrimidine photo-lyase [Candidatus Uabimicrobium amorphum]